ncbi:MAG: tyrosine-type recombinase/integrase [Desulfobacteraceae bacterium]|nr:tyrosine-type recombinase/integrase [Desulfobacteraceae bacterium]
MNSLNISLDNLLIQYQLSLEAANGSPKTFQGYSDILRRFFDFLKDKGHINSVSDIGREEVRVYTKSLQNAKRWPNKPQNGEDRGKLSPATVQDHIRAIKAFWSWLQDNGYIEKNILVKYPLPKAPKIIIKTLTIDQIKLFLKAIDKSSSVGARNYCIVLLMIDNGMRISEVVSIQISDIDLSRCRVKIIGKGKKERIVPFTKITRKELLKYKGNNRNNLCKLDSPYLFPGSDGDHVSIKSIQQSISRLSGKIGLDGIKYHPHIFRHTFATLFLTNGGQLTTLKEIMGHEDIQTTQKYVHFLPEDLRKQHWNYSPVEDLFR